MVEHRKREKEVRDGAEAGGRHVDTYMEIKLYSETGSARETVTHLTTRLWDGMDGQTDGRMQPQTPRDPRNEKRSSVEREEWDTTTL